MALNPDIIARCQQKLAEVARQRSTITYGDLAAHLGVANQGVGRYLEAVYDDLVREERNLPDLTLLAVYSGTNYGRYNSRGAAAQTVRFDPDDPRQRDRYDRDRERVYQHWSSGGAEQ